MFTGNTLPGLTTRVVVALCLGVLLVAPSEAFARGGKKKNDEKSAAETAFEAGYGSDDAMVRADAVAALRDAPDALKVKLIASQVLRTTARPTAGSSSSRRWPGSTAPPPTRRCSPR